jgi:hypothetical protein
MAVAVNSERQTSNKKGIELHRGGHNTVERGMKTFRPAGETFRSQLRPDPIDVPWMYAKDIARYASTKRCRVEKRGRLDIGM